MTGLWLALLAAVGLVAAGVLLWLLIDMERDIRRINRRLRGKE